MTNTQTHKNPRELTQRVLLLANLIVFFAPWFRCRDEIHVNSTDLHGMNAALLLYPKTARIQTIAPAINPLVGCLILKIGATES